MFVLCSESRYIRVTQTKGSAQWRGLFYLTDGGLCGYFGSGGFELFSAGLQEGGGDAWF